MTELVGALTETIGAAFRRVHVEGEISNLKRPPSGHLYFTLKDADAQMRCVMWQSNAEHLRFRTADGMAVRVRGGVTVYAARGDLQLSVSSMAPAGEGALQKAFAELGRRLKGEGLFDPARKRPLPRFPSRIGVITSDSGAALRDILTVLRRRFPLAVVVVRSVLVQGELASGDIVEALREMNRLPSDDSQRPDVIILGRGGGSLEDLWAFNEEATVRAVHASGIPVITGIGHQTDITLCGLAADKRAATPSMAAELAVPDQVELMSVLTTQVERQTGLIRARIGKVRALVDRAIRLRSYASPQARLTASRSALDTSVRRLDRAGSSVLRAARLRLEARATQLAAGNPMRPLSTGFALLEADGRPITSASDVPEDSTFDVRFKDGVVSARRARNEEGNSPFIAPDSAGDSLN